MTLRTISYGGGVQSSALVVLATQGRIGHVDAALRATLAAIEALCIAYANGPDEMAPLLNDLWALLHPNPEEDQ